MEEAPNLLELAQKIIDAPAQEVEPEAQQEASQEAPAETEPSPEPDWESLKGLRRKFTVKGEDGADQEVEMTLEEMQSSVMMQRDYQRKTQELARQRESIDKQMKDKIDPVVRQYQEQLALAEKALLHVIAPEIQNTDWNKLAQEDPAEWARKMQYTQNVQNLLQAVRAENQKIEFERQQQTHQTLQKQIEEARDTLTRDIQGWSDELYLKVLSTGIENGFTQDEVRNVTDPRVIKVLNKARLYDELVKAKPGVEKRVAQVPKVAKPGSSEKPNADDEKRKQAMAKLKKTGRTEDALEAAKLFV